jgi:hypothetical protein
MFLNLLCFVYGENEHMYRSSITKDVTTYSVIDIKTGGKQLMETGILNSWFQAVFNKSLGTLCRFLGSSYGRQKELRAHIECWTSETHSNKNAPFYFFYILDLSIQFSLNKCFLAKKNNLKTVGLDIMLWKFNQI